MSNITLNDVTYSFEPLKIVKPDPDYKVDEVKLQESIEKSKKMMKIVEDYKKRRANETM